MIDYGYASARSDLAALVPLVHGAEGGGGIVGMVDKLLERIGGLIASGADWVLFPGIKTLAANVHPMIVHFPIAFLSAFFLLDMFGAVFRRAAVRQAAGWMLYLGAVGAVAAVAAGLIAAAEVPHGEAVHEVMEWHERLMWTVTGLALVLATWRAVSGGSPGSPMAQVLHGILATVMITLLVLGTDLGGLMVYRHGVGVVSLQATEETQRHRHGADSEREWETDPQPSRAGPSGPHRR